MITAIGVLIFGAFMGTWCYYTAIDMAQEKLDEVCIKTGCDGCPFADLKNGCCNHPFWAPSMCVLREPYKK